VTAESLYEAVALGLLAIRLCSWVKDIGQNFTIRVLARDTPVEHTVEFRSVSQMAGTAREKPKGHHGASEGAGDFGAEIK